MELLNVERIYGEIMLLSDSDRNKLYSRIKNELYQNSESATYTTFGKPLTHEQYRQRVNAGIEQCMKGESISLEDFSKELGYHYADL
jgi:hypothetical protein